MVVARLYCGRSDVHTFGLPRGVLTNAGRVAASALAASDAIELDQHQFENADTVLVRAEAGGALPGGLVAGTTYYVSRLTESTFQLATTAMNAALNIPIDFTSDGSRVRVIERLDTRVETLIEFYSRFADTRLVAHGVPLEDGSIPMLIKGVVAQCVAGHLLAMQGQRSESILELQKAAHLELDRLAKGIPIRDPKATSPANLAVAGHAGGYAAPAFCAYGFTPRGDTIP